MSSTPTECLLKNTVKNYRKIGGAHQKIIFCIFLGISVYYPEFIFFMVQ